MSIAITRVMSGTVTTSTPKPSSSSSETFPTARHTRADDQAKRDVHLTALTIGYQRSGQEVIPVQDFDLFAPAGQVTALVGRSGSGKTSVLSCVAGMLRPKSGAVWVGGIEVTGLTGKTLDTYRRNHVGVVHQAYNLIGSLTVEENVSVPLSLIGVRRREAKAKAIELLNELGISSLANRRPNQLSGGQQQRVAVARALATNPSVVVADEPTAHLDGSSVSDVCAVLRAMANAGRTVIVSTHDDRLLAAVDHTVAMSA
jgi:putative ABC transport system ATP-binding protein